MDGATRDAYAPVRRDAHAAVEKLTAGSIPAPFHFSNFEESVLDRSEVVEIAFLLTMLPEVAR